MIIIALSVTLYSIELVLLKNELAIQVVNKVCKKGERIMKILFLVEGNANSPDTWSNVPYFFINSLSEVGGGYTRNNTN